MSRKVTKRLRNTRIELPGVSSTVNPCMTMPSAWLTLSPSAASELAKFRIVLSLPAPLMVMPRLLFMISPVDRLKRPAQKLIVSPSRASKNAVSASAVEFGPGQIE